MCKNIMPIEYFTIGSSLVHALPTLLYMGAYRRKNRLNLIENPSGLADFVSIPYESLVIGILFAYGVAFTVMQKMNKKDNGTKNVRNAAITGAVLGLSLSLIGRHIFDLPVKHFGMIDQPWSVHIVAPVLYAIIFVLIEKIGIGETR